MADGSTPAEKGGRRRWWPAVIGVLAVTGLASAPNASQERTDVRDMALGLIERGQAEGGAGGPYIPAAPGIAPAWRQDRWLKLAMSLLPLGAPLAEYQVGSPYGRRRDPINRRAAMHEGIDLTAPRRTEVFSTGPGQVVHAGPKGRYGRLVEIDHGMGVRTRYAHLAAVKVRVGQRIRAGEVVGLLGSSGRSTGAHLHYEILVDGRARDPEPFIRAGRARTAGGQDFRL